MNRFELSSNEIWLREEIATIMRIEEIFIIIISGILFRCVFQITEYNEIQMNQ
jgi:hypothetical protein